MIIILYEMVLEVVQILVIEIELSELEMEIEVIVIEKIGKSDYRILELEEK